MESDIGMSVIGYLSRASSLASETALDSLFRAGFSGEILLAVESGDEPRVESLPTYTNLTVVPVSSDPNSCTGIRRLTAYQQVLERAEHLRRAICVDLEDVLFQDDPAFVFGPMSSLGMFSERSSRTVGTCPELRWWICQLFGEVAFWEIASKATLTPSVYFGDRSMLSSFVQQQLEAIDELPGKLNLDYDIRRCDIVPAVHHAIFYSRRVEESIVFDNGSGPVFSLSWYEGTEIPFGKDAMVMNLNRTRPVILTGVSSHRFLTNLAIPYLSHSEGV